MGDIVEYGQYSKTSGKTLEPVNGTAKNGLAQVSLLKNEQRVLQGFLHNKAEQKIDYYNKKIAEMKQKYNMDFSAFQNRIYLKATEVDFEEWNDFVLWGSYVKAYRYWAQFC